MSILNVNNAVIINNNPCCPICKGNPILGSGTGDYCLVEHEGKKYYRFQRYCDGGCHGKYYYYAIININEETKRYVFDNDIKQVEEDN